MFAAPVIIQKNNANEFVKDNYNAVFIIDNSNVMEVKLAVNRVVTNIDIYKHNARSTFLEIFYYKNYIKYFMDENSNNTPVDGTIVKENNQVNIAGEEAIAEVEKKTKGNEGLIVIIFILFFAVIAMGTYIFIKEGYFTEKNPTNTIEEEKKEVIEALKALEGIKRKLQDLLKK